MDTDYSFFKPYYEMALRMQNDDKTCMDFGTLKTSCTAQFSMQACHVWK